MVKESEWTIPVPSLEDLRDGIDLLVETYGKRTYEETSGVKSLNLSIPISPENKCSVNFSRSNSLYEICFVRNSQEQGDNAEQKEWWVRVESFKNPDHVTGEIVIGYASNTILIPDEQRRIAGQIVNEAWQTLINER